MELRLIPVVTFAAASLLAVKAVSLVHFDGRLPFETVFSSDKWRELAALGGDEADITGSAPAPKESAAPHNSGTGHGTPPPPTR